MSPSQAAGPAGAGPRGRPGLPANALAPLPGPGTAVGSGTGPTTGPGRTTGVAAEAGTEPGCGLTARRPPPGPGCRAAWPKPGAEPRGIRAGSPPIQPEWSSLVWAAGWLPGSLSNDGSALLESRAFKFKLPGRGCRARATGTTANNSAWAVQLGCGRFTVPGLSDSGSTSLPLSGGKWSQNLT
jgi:hypothetical protein